MLPECRLAVRAFDTCETQWRVAFGGATGLDYAACLAVLQLYLPRWLAEASAEEGEDVGLPELMDDLRIIERAFLDAMEEKAEKKRQQKQTED
ncbi:DUF1799 domain-containing protein [Dyella amyloliquefaciens]|uniref:DUF1799 domain-containing protein n=1 Tax=Dyella amyloliquefaciens TaxID=1770545 RepID=UPI00102EA3DD|nr:DUF1799 domain-containing protein [Dyella amyloliquefaciens]